MKEMPLVLNSIQYNQALGDTRRQLHQLRTALKCERSTARLSLPKAPEPSQWQSPYLGIHAVQTIDFKRPKGRKPKDLSQYQDEFHANERTFVCPSCRRELPISKKYAKEQCQTCYKRNKKAQK